MEDLHEKLEEYISIHTEEDIWKTVIELENISGIEIHTILLEINTYNLIRKATKNGFKYTTHKMYEKHNSFWHKLLDAWFNSYS